MSKNKKISRKRLIKLTMAQRKDCGPRDLKDAARNMIEVEQELQGIEAKDPRNGGYLRKIMDRLCWRDQL